MIALLLTPMNPCPEDVDKDGWVDVDDYNLVANNNGECPIGQFCWYDVNGDCVVDDADETQVQAAYGECEESDSFGGS